MAENEENGTEGTETQETAGKVNEITASKKINGEDKSVTVVYDFGGTVEAAIEKFGAQVVYSNFTRAAVITAQAIMRREMEAGKTSEQIAEKMATWKPGVAIERVVDPIGATMSKFKSMSAEEQNALIEKLMAMQAGAAQPQA